MINPRSFPMDYPLGEWGRLFVDGAVSRSSPEKHPSAADDFLF
jgi:hypothetical protein